MQLDNIETIEKHLWEAADTLRTNSNYASNEYFMPVMGLIFLRHAYSRFLAVKDDIEAGLPTRGGMKPNLKKTDFAQKGALFLRPEAQFDYLVDLTDADDRADAVEHAMESIEKDYETLKGQLPKAEYKELDNDILGQLLRTLNPDELKQAKGDVFGRIYEYFLTGFANLKAHDAGEFFTPISLVEMITNVIEPDHGKVLDPACGSGGMFVQSAHFVERLQKNPNQVLTFYGMEKNPTTIRLAKMNLAVHGLEGNIQKAITYYDDPHSGLWGDADFVMANPPFNTDEVDADKVKKDRRLPYGLPGVNKKKKVSNGNYLWISYFLSYLKEDGRAGFVMSSQASSAGGDEAKVREAIIKSGNVDVMLDVRGNFFYTRSVPCQLWFFNKNKPKKYQDKVLMLDARNVYRKVTRKIYDFSPEQLQNLTSIVWLYRGESDRFLELVSRYQGKVLEEALEVGEPAKAFNAAITALAGEIDPFMQTVQDQTELQTTCTELKQTSQQLSKDIAAYLKQTGKTDASWQGIDDSAKGLQKALKLIEPIAEQSRDLVKDADHVYKLASRLIEQAEKDHEAKQSDDWNSREINKQRKAADELRKKLVAQLKQARYFYKQALWLQSRFPAAKLVDVEGLVKLVDHKELEANDWSLTPGRYVGVAPEEVDEDFDFEEALRDIHIELKGLNEEAAVLAQQIARNFEELGV
ncbi:MAG: type I restriction-modification system subunit M [Gammaproteobacteria bacterium]|nr:type I restriction-modification system subunit M [Gammaproteobacteria bacterium]MDH5653176.1 type I restriction-modification system subunit M [Gammaproteobacteria bacterium]